MIESRVRSERKPLSVWIGFDEPHPEAFFVARESLRQRMGVGPRINGLVLDDLRARGLYTRPTTRRMGRLFDEISQHEMSTEFAISRFLVPLLARSGWALFSDCDVLYRANPMQLFEQLEFAGSDKALFCVQHDHVPSSAVKMDDQKQAAYPRKNWSSVMLFNCDHPANRRLDLAMVNSLPGRDLHRFCWLQDSEIGALDPAWNFLVNESPPLANPKLVHFTLGGPWLEGFRNVPFADEWRSTLYRLAA